MAGRGGGRGLPSQEAYDRVRKDRSDDIQDNEVRITAINKVRNYISYAMALLEEKGHSAVVLKAMGKAINKSIIVAEVLKRRIAGLHQLTEISSADIVDVWEPKEEGLDRVETSRRVSVISITLSKAPLDTAHIGYQPPLPEDQVRPFDEREFNESQLRPRRGRGRGRGSYRGRGRGRDGANGHDEYYHDYHEGGEGEGEGGHYYHHQQHYEEGEGWEGGRGRGRFRGRGPGRGRGGRGRGRGEEGGGGGYYYHQEQQQEEAGGGGEYREFGPRGRGRGEGASGGGEHHEE